MELIHLDILRNRRNLLAFSAGTDSSALFDSLVKEGIGFDMIMVDYGVRAASKIEVEHARRLASENGKILHLKEIALKGESNFEKRARDARYEFFDSVMERYDNLVLGHNLSDKTEWFLMQLTRGAGIRELFGMDGVSQRKGYTVVRPLLDTTKSEVMEYLELRGTSYFFDESNLDQKYERNYFRHEFSERLLADSSQGIKKTFRILEKEKDLLPKGELVFECGEYSQWKIDPSSASHLLSRLLKRKGYLLSGPQREEFENDDEITVAIGGQRVSSTYSRDSLFVSPYFENPVPKRDRECMRKIGIPPKHRPYYYKKVVRGEG